MVDVGTPARSAIRLKLASLFVILFSLIALAGGFLSGNAAVPRISLHGPTPDPVPSTAPLDVHAIRGLAMPQTDELAYDDFAADAAVVPDAASGSITQDAHLAIVVVGCGHSPPLEAPFLALGVPLAVVIDPDGAAARQMAQLAASSGTPFFIQATDAPDRAQLEAWERALPGARGVAARLEEPLPGETLHALRLAHFAVLDEFGTNADAARAVKNAGLRYLRRTITVDDHLQPSYVDFMLDQAVHLGRGGHTVIMARPLPGTLRALQALVAQAARDGVRFGSPV